VAIYHQHEPLRDPGTPPVHQQFCLWVALVLGEAVDPQAQRRKTRCMDLPSHMCRHPECAHQAITNQWTSVSMSRRSMSEMHCGFSPLLVQDFLRQQTVRHRQADVRGPGLSPSTAAPSALLQNAPACRSTIIDHPCLAVRIGASFTSMVATHGISTSDRLEAVVGDISASTP